MTELDFCLHCQVFFFNFLLPQIPLSLSSQTADEMDKTIREESEMRPK